MSDRFRKEQLRWLEKLEAERVAAFRKVHDAIRTVAASGKAAEVTIEVDVEFGSVANPARYDIKIPEGPASS